MEGILLAIAWAAGILTGGTKAAPKLVDRVLQNKDGEPAINLPPALMQLLVAALPILLTLIGCPVPQITPQPTPAPIVIPMPQEAQPVPASLQSPSRLDFGAKLAHYAAYRPETAGVSWTLFQPAAVHQVATVDPVSVLVADAPVTDPADVAPRLEPEEAAALMRPAPVIHRQPAAVSSCRSGYCPPARPRGIFRRR
jgi:hypothetical protein